MRNHHGYIFSYRRMKNTRLLILMFVIQNLGRSGLTYCDKVVNQTLASFQMCVKTLNTPVTPAQEPVNI
jgi:hypothetical protein